MRDKLQDLEELLPHKRSKAYYAKKLNISELEVEKLLKQLKKREKPPPNEDEGEIIEEDIEKHTIKCKKFSDTRPSSPEEVMALHKANPRKWKLKSFRSEQKGDKWIVTALFCPLKDAEEDLKAQKDILLKELKSELQSHRKYPLPHHPSPQRTNLLEVSIPDLHFGKLAWEEEVGEDYDLKIATERVRVAVRELLSRINLNSVDRILFPIGNDLINIDNEKGTTTAGTPQSCDSRFAKMVKVTRQVLIETIDLLAEVAPVDIPIVVGNHDQTISFLIGEILDAYYHDNLRVTINNSPKSRKYYKYYNNSFQFTHGNQEQHNDLGLIFATEEPKIWGDTEYRYCQLGHYHKSKKISYIAVSSHTGFQIEILPSLSATDSWHYNKGYISNKQAKAFMYDQQKGEIACFTYTV